MARTTIDWNNLARDQAPDRSAPQTQTPELPPDPRPTPEQTPSPTSTRPAAPAGAEPAFHAFEEFQKRLAAHLADAASSRIHPFEAPGWHPLADQRHRTPRDAPV